MSEFEFVDALPPQHTHLKPRQPDKTLVRFAAALKSRPGVWAKYPKPLKASGAGSVAWAIRNGHSKQCPLSLKEPGFGAVIRGGVVYVRYLQEAAS